MGNMEQLLFFCRHVTELDAFVLNLMHRRLPQQMFDLCTLHGGLCSNAAHLFLGCLLHYFFNSFFIQTYKPEGGVHFSSRLSLGKDTVAF